MRSCLIAILGLNASLATACKSTGRSDSELKHIWGETLRPPHALNCVEMESFDPFFQAYVHKHIDRITSRNPAVFRGALDGQKFCVMPIESSEIDAGASGDGTLIFNTGLIQVADTDAQFAAAVAHELAHITLNHGLTDFEGFVSLHPEYQAEADGIAAHEARLNKELKSLEQIMAGWSDPLSQAAFQETMTLAVSALRQEFNKDKTSFDACKSLQRMQTGEVKQERYRKAWQLLQAKLNAEGLQNLAKIEEAHCRYYGAFFPNDYLKRSLLSNWIETEADEAGYEFFLRASWHQDEYAKFFRNIDRFYGGVETRAEDCRRGEANHPKDCWRALQAVREWERHQESIQQLPELGTTTMAFDQDLAQLMKAYRTVAPSP